MNFRKLIAVFFAFSVILGACKKSEDEEKNVVESYASQIAPFLDSNCSSCHYGGRQEPDMRIGYSYSSLVGGGFVVKGNARESILVQQISTGHPKDGVVSQSQLELIKMWINQGANNN